MKKYIDEEGHEVRVWYDGTKYWYKNGLQHRDNDKPAVVFRNGTKHWYKNGKLHRDNDKPAFFWGDGSKGWYKNGLLHRENNQARIGRTLPQEVNFCFLNAKMYQPKEYWIRLLLLEY